jgi:mRNA interferase RelE/StbE
MAPSAQRDYKKISYGELEKINKTIDELSMTPRPSGYKKLKNRNAYRIRIGDYRIIYEIHEKEKVIMVFRIRHRKEVYRKL